MTQRPSPLIEIRGLSRTFVSSGGIETRALDGIDLDIHEGEFLAIRGASGSGKSTLLNILGCLDRPTSGTYRIAGVDVSHYSVHERARLRQRTFGFIFQRYHLIPGLSASDNIEVPAIHAGLPRETRSARAGRLMNLLGLGDHAWKRPWQLSGGQQQRVAIARALMNGGSIILADEPTGALDSRNSVEVIAIVRELARTGRTIILVTHESAVAAEADRIIEVADGRIVSDQIRRARDAKASVAEIPPAAAYEAAAGAWWTPITEAGRSALASMRANLLRTGLTLLGVVIGVASVVALAAIGRGTEVEMIERTSALVANIIYVTDRREPGQAYTPLSSADAVAVSEVPNVADVVPIVERHGVISHGGRQTATEIIGVTRSHRGVYRWEAQVGSYFSEEEEKRGAAVTLIGKTIADRIFPDVPDPTGSTVLIDRKPFTILGVLQEKGLSLNGEDYDRRLIVPLNAMIYRLSGRSDLNHIIVEIGDMSQIATTREAVRATVADRHGKMDFSIADTAQAFQRVNDERTAMSIRLIAIGGISLLVGGIGIMNMMLTSVRERTREIGIRTATGATPGDILRQFLIEAVVISGTGGLIGLVIGIGIGAAAAYLGATVIVSITSAALAFLSALGLGIVFGFMPARHAASLEPVEALASE